MLRGMPVPLPDLDTQPFWDGCKEDRFLVPRCAECGVTRWPPGPMCPACQSRETAWTEIEGHGTLYSWTVVTHPPDEVLVDQVPYAVGLVELPEGVRVVANVLGADPAELRAGMRLELCFETTDAGVRLPNFRAAGSPTPADREDAADAA